MIRIAGRYRPSSYFPGFSSRPAKYRSGLFLGGTVFLLLLLVPGSRSVLALSGTGNDPVLLSIAVTPADASIFPDRAQQFTATGTYSDGRTHDLTRRATWSSSVPAVATINRVGAASARAVGRTTIEAALGAINGSATLNVVIAATFVLTGSMSAPLSAQTATLLNNGMVLVAGGDGCCGAVATAELYDPATGSFTPTGSLQTARDSHTATLLNNGMVLIAGGGDSNGDPTASGELYDPATGTFSYTGSMITARTSDTATLLNNGIVLIAGGVNIVNGFSILATAELYDPATGTFTPTGSLNTARLNHTATLLNNGMVLIAGGLSFNSQNGDFYPAAAELYDPATGTFTDTGSLNTPREVQTATLLNNGMVLIAGGSGGDSAELYNPVTGSFTSTGSMNAPLRPATLLNNGMVLMAGGPFGAEPTAELYNPTTETFAPTSNSINSGTTECTATLLNSGIVLITSCDTGTAELYEPVLCPPPDLKSIAITPTTSTLSPGATQRFVAMGTFSDGTTQQLASVTWFSSNPAVAEISNDASNHGTALAIARGEVIIAAHAGWVWGWAWLRVQ
jgi:large repetitive protein